MSPPAGPSRKTHGRASLGGIAGPGQVPAASSPEPLEPAAVLEASDADLSGADLREADLREADAGR